MSKTILEYETIDGMLDAKRIRAAERRFSDRSYVCIDKNWLLITYKFEFRRFCNKYLLKYRPEAFDCDNFARCYANYLDILHSATPDAPVCGIAIAEFHYVTDAGGGHAINLAICNNKEFVFIEPQTCDEVILTQTEICNAQFIRF